LPEVTCFFSPQSGYAYLGHARLREIAQATEAGIIWRPVDILTVFAEGGSTPPAKQSEVRNAYRKTDQARWARVRGIPFSTNPSYWPTDTIPACRLIEAAHLYGQEPGDLIGALLSAVWAKDVQISDPDNLVRIADEAGYDGKRLLELSQEEAAAEAVKANTADAIAAGVFGSPSYVVDGELYFGQDRLDFVAAHLAFLKDREGEAPKAGENRG